MKKATSEIANTTLSIKNVSEVFTPSKEQINIFAERLVPEIKKFFTDERTQKEFNDWKKKHYVA